MVRSRLRRGHFGKLGPPSRKAERCDPVRASPLRPPPTPVWKPSLSHLLSWGLVKVLGFYRTPFLMAFSLFLPDPARNSVRGEGQLWHPLSVGGPERNSEECGTVSSAASRLLSPPGNKRIWHPVGLLWPLCRCFLAFPSALGMASIQRGRISLGGGMGRRKCKMLVSDGVR